MTIPIDTDESLVAEAQQGSHDAFGELVSRYQHRAYATAVAVLSDFELAQDVAQEAFLCAYHDLPKLKDPARFGAWVSGIARYMALAARRERGKLRAVVEQYRGEQPLVQSSTPERELESDERRQVVHRALERLNDKDREVLELQTKIQVCEKVLGVTGVARSDKPRQPSPTHPTQHPLTPYDPEDGP